MGQHSSRNRSTTTTTTTTTTEPTTTLATVTTMTTTTMAQRDYVKYASVGSILFVVLVLLLAVCLYLIHKKRNHLRKDPDISQKVRTKEEENSERPTNSFEYTTSKKMDENILYATVQKPHAQDPKDAGLEHPEVVVAKAPSVIYSAVEFEVESQPTTVHHPERVSEYASIKFK